MIIHHNQNDSEFRFIAFYIPGKNCWARATNARRALALIREHPYWRSDEFEILDCGRGGKKVWDGIPLDDAQKRYPTVFRGLDYGPQNGGAFQFPRIPLAESA